MNIGSRGSAYSYGDQTQRTGMNGGAASGWERISREAGTNTAWTSVPSDTNHGFTQVREHPVNLSPWKPPPTRNLSGALHNIVKNANVQAAKAAAQRMADRVRPPRRTIGSMVSPEIERPVNLPGVSEAIQAGEGLQEIYPNAPMTMPHPIQRPTMLGNLGGPRRVFAAPPMGTHGASLVNPVAATVPTRGANLVNAMPPPVAVPRPLNSLPTLIPSGIAGSAQREQVGVRLAAMQQLAQQQRAAALQRALAARRV